LGFLRGVRYGEALFERLRRRTFFNDLASFRGARIRSREF